MKKGARTRRRILDVAATLFAADGFAGTSVRQIAQAAEVNVAAVSMYFDSKEGLYRTILDEGLSSLVARRYDTLHAYRESGSTDLDGVLRAFVSPLYDMLDGDARDADFLRILSRTLFEPDAAFQGSAAAAASEIIESFVGEIRRCVPGLKPRQIRQRLGFSIGAISQALADPNRPPGPGARQELLRFLSAAFRET